MAEDGGQDVRGAASGALGRLAELRRLAAGTAARDDAPATVTPDGVPVIPDLARQMARAADRALVRRRVPPAHPDDDRPSPLPGISEGDVVEMGASVESTLHLGGNVVDLASMVRERRAERKKRDEAGLKPRSVEGAGIKAAVDLSDEGEALVPAGTVLKPLLAGDNVPSATDILEAAMLIHARRAAAGQAVALMLAQQCARDLAPYRSPRLSAVAVARVDPVEAMDDRALESLHKLLAGQSGPITLDALAHTTSGRDGGDA